MGRRHARVLASLPDRFELVGAYDPRADLPWLDPVPRLATEAEAVARAELVVVATPTQAHGATLARALSAGRHVLVEKPLCATFAEAQTVATAFARSQAKLFVGHSERFNPVVRALARLLRHERVVAIDLHRAGPSRSTDCGVLVNLGVHDFDLAAYLGGGALTLHASLGTASAAHVLFNTAGGAVGHLYVDGSATAKRRAIAVVTPRWAYHGDLLEPRLVRSARTPPGALAPPQARCSRPGAARCTSEVPLPLDEPLLVQATALADALDGAGCRFRPRSPGTSSSTPPRKRAGGGDAPFREIATGADGARAVEIAELAGAACATAAEKLSLFARP